MKFKTLKDITLTIKSGSELDQSNIIENLENPAFIGMLEAIEIQNVVDSEVKEPKKVKSKK